MRKTLAYDNNIVIETRPFNTKTIKARGYHMFGIGTTELLIGFVILFIIPMYTLGEISRRLGKIINILEEKKKNSD